MSLSFSRRGFSKSKHSEEIIGCTFEELEEHLKETWKENYGTEYNGEDVHIDHIIPLAEGSTIEEIIRLCHWSNLQYLKPEDNIDKGDKLDWCINKD